MNLLFTFLKVTGSLFFILPYLYRIDCDGQLTHALRKTQICTSKDNYIPSIYCLDAWVHVKYCDHVRLIELAATCRETNNLSPDVQLLCQTLKVDNLNYAFLDYPRFWWRTIAEWTIQSYFPIIMDFLHSGR